MKSTCINIAKRLTWALLITGAAITSAHAKHDGNQPLTATGNSQWQAECGSCHIAYSPRMLHAESWRAVMAGLDRHFGTDASLDAVTTQQISSFLEKNAGSRKEPGTGKPVLRISETRWFIREHRKLSSKVWASDLVKSPANCTACHASEPSGNYSERNVRVPQ